MGYYQSVYLGACIKIEVTTETQECFNSIMYSDENVDKLYTVNGNWGTPENNIYYLAPNGIVDIYGLSISGDDNESGSEVTPPDLNKWLGNFNRDYGNVLTQFITSFGDKCQLIVGFVNGGS